MKAVDFATHVLKTAVASPLSVGGIITLLAVLDGSVTYKALSERLDIVTQRLVPSIKSLREEGLLVVGVSKPAQFTLTRKGKLAARSFLAAPRRKEEEKCQQD